MMCAAAWYERGRVVRAGMPLEVDELIRLGRVGDLRPSPDGTWACVVVQRLNEAGDKYVSDLWRVPTDGGPAIRLTRGDHNDRAPRFRADGALAFLSNRNPRAGEPKPGDDQRMQVWVMPPVGEPAPLTDEPLGVDDFGFAGDRLVMLAEVVPGLDADKMREVAADRAKSGPSALHYKKGETLRHWQEWLPETALHLVVIDPDGGRRDLTPAARHQLRGHLADQQLAIAPGGGAVAVLWATRGAQRLPESTVRSYDLATGAMREMGAAPLVLYSSPRWSPDGATIAAVRSTTRWDVGPIERLWRFSVATGDAVGAPVAPDWDVHPHLHGFTGDGAALVCSADVEGTSPPFRVELATGAVTQLVAGGTIEQLRIVDGGARAIVARSGQLHPAELFVVELGAPGTARPLATLSGFPRERGAALVDVETAWVPGDGGTPIQYLLVKPRGVARPPVLFWIHGGPVGQWSDGWHFRWNPIVAASAGYAVVLPNPRGSTGRGQAFVDGVFNNAWGGACFVDLMAVATAVAQRGDVDGARMVAMGGSFGGYMVNWIGVQDHRFRAIVSHAGIYSFRAFHGVSDYPAYFSLEMGGTPWDEKADYSKYSPDAFVSRWRTPTLIIHGEKDYRVPISEALLLYEALDAHGIDVELLAFPDEGHWITRPRNIQTWYRTWLEFVGKRLG
jgi:dipeptidyl aminopeptidase/acylaminoacyl peptidase